MSLILLGLSLLFGILSAVNRLRDFRQTKDIARDLERLKDKGMNDVQIKEALKQRRDDVENLGTWTWRFFWFQLASFSLGVLALVLVFASVYRNKLGF